MFNKFKKQKSSSQPPEIRCLKCSKIISSEAVLKAEEKSKKKIEESMKKYGTISVKAKWEILCNHCGHRVYYNLHDGSISEK